MGELTYLVKEGVIVVDHIFVHPDYRGQKLARTLVLAAIEKARHENLKIFPTCPYAVAFFKHHSEYASLLK